jgi:choline dehydrogenase
MDLQDSYDFIVCGAGSSGSVVARRLAENPDVRVLLLEAGGTDAVPSVMEPTRWSENLGSERDWGFKSQANPHLAGRSLDLSMGKVLGGGSSINGMMWSRGHRNDWDFFAAECGDRAWSYESVSKLYQRVEDWHGPLDPGQRGTGGPMFVQPAANPGATSPALVEGARTLGIPVFENPNGRMMEGDGGVAITDVIVRNGQRQSVFRSYVAPILGQRNLTVLTRALVARLIIQGTRVLGVEVVYNDRRLRIHANLEVILSLGAIETPRVLMQSGIGDQAELRRLGIPVGQHLPGVGRNYQDHFLIFGCLWDYRHPGVNPSDSRAVLFWKSRASLDTPDLQILQSVAGGIRAVAHRLGLAADSWLSLAPGVVRTQSTGRIRLTGKDVQAPVTIESNTLSHPDELRAAVRGIELCREIAASMGLRPYIGREWRPGNLRGQELEQFVRQNAMTFWHQTCTAKMGRDALSVVDSRLRVHGLERLRIADGSVMPRVTTGNTMAPCTIIGERAADVLKEDHLTADGVPQPSG